MMEQQQQQPQQQDLKHSSASPAPEEEMEDINQRQLLAKSFPTREFLLAPLLRQGQQMMIYAPPGLGKSMLVLSMAQAVAEGGSLLGWKAPAPRRVLLVDGEMPMDDIQERIKVLLPAVGGDLQNASENLIILGRHHQKRGVNLPDLAAPEGQARLLDRIHLRRAELVILDNLSTLAKVQDENAASAFNPIVDFLACLKQEGIACILVHHANKGRKGFRGSSMLATTFETIGRLSTPQKFHPGDLCFSLEWEKFRGRSQNGAKEPLDIWLEQDQQEGQAARWVKEENEDAKLTAMVQLVRTREYPTQEDLAKVMKVTPGTISKWRHRAITRGLISKGEWAGCLKEAKEGGLVGGDQDDNQDF